MNANCWLLGALHDFLKRFGAPGSSYTIALDAHPPRRHGTALAGSSCVQLLPFHITPRAALNLPWRQRRRFVLCCALGLALHRLDQFYFSLFCLAGLLMTRPLPAAFRAAVEE